MGVIFQSAAVDGQQLVDVCVVRKVGQTLGVQGLPGRQKDGEKLGGAAPFFQPLQVHAGLGQPFQVGLLGPPGGQQSVAVQVDIRDHGICPQPSSLASWSAPGTSPADTP